MAEKHECPACKGGRETPDGGCRTCNDTGLVVKSPAEEAATSSSQGYDPREITGL